MNNKSQIDIQKSARMAGLLYLLLAIFTGAPSAIRSNLFIHGDAAGTVANLLKSEMLFRISIAGDMIGMVLMVMLALALYDLLKTVDRWQANLMAALALVSVPIALLNQTELFATLLLLNGSDPAQVMFYVNLFHQGGLIAGIFWGLWMVPLAILIIKSGFLPKVLGVLLYVAAAGYVFDSFSAFLFPGLGISVALFTFWGEVVLLLWLLIKGVNVGNWQKHMAQVA
jgi:hypothetical protein